MSNYEDSSDSEFSFSYSPPSPDALYSSPDVDGPVVPISSSPRVASSPPSFECAYSLPETEAYAPTRPISPSEGHHSSCGNEFSAALDERLLLLASRMQDDSDSGSSGDHEEPTPRSTFRLVKRAHSCVSSRQESLQFPKYQRVESNSDAASTEPSTPVPSRRWCTDVPVIAPPPSYIPRLPLSAETEAKIRIGKFLEREGKERTRDGLLDMHISLGCGSSDGEEDSQDLDDGSDWEESHQTRCTAPHTPEAWEEILQIGQELREQVIDWMTGVILLDPQASLFRSKLILVLKVLPKHASGRYVPSRTGSCSSNSSFSSTSTTTSCEPSNLYDQLAYNPETRIHAVWMLLRYFWRKAHTDKLAEVEDRVSTANGNSNGLDDSDRALLIWDTALACLALSVKFHRDFLVPLYPVHAHEFLDLAHHEVYYGDFEGAQRDILKTLDYSLGVSPQAILNEIWLALPSLREILNFDGGWNALRKAVWLRLFDVVYAADVLRFPQSRLVAVALIDSLVPCLAARYEYESGWHARAFRRTRQQKVKGEGKAKFTKRAVRDAAEVIFDVQAVVGVTDGQLEECRVWWSGAMSTTTT